MADRVALGDDPPILRAEQDVTADPSAAYRLSLSHHLLEKI